MTVQLPMDMRGRCVMCDGPGPLTDEHVISKTVRKQLPLLSAVTETFAGITSKPRNVLHLVLKKAVCAKCNGGWMSDLEDDVVAAIGFQFANAVTMRIDPSQQERIATWAIKTALLIEMHTSARGKGTYVPIDNLRWLAEHHTPPPRARVWMAGVNSQMKRLAWSQSGYLSVPPGEKVGCLATFSVGHVGFQAFCMDIVWPQDDSSRRVLSDVAPPPPVRAATVNIWPGNYQNVIWPPMNDGKPTILDIGALPEWAAWPSIYYKPPPTP